MDEKWLATLLLLAGIAFIAAGTLLLLKTPGASKKTGAVILIGPIPIIIANDKKTAIALAATALALLLLLLLNQPPSNR